jgi:hypothetical protein
VNSLTKLNIYAEWTEDEVKQKIFVGTLEVINDEYVIQYTQEWIGHPLSIDIGEDIPLTLTPVKSHILWKDISNRIPPKSYSTYNNYCEAWGVVTGEQNILLLLATVGHRIRGNCFVLYGPDELYVDD